MTGAIAGRWVAQYLLAGRSEALSLYQAEWRSHDHLGRWLRYQSLLRKLYDRIGTDEAMERIAAAAIKLSYPVKNVVGTEPGYRRTMVTVNVTRSLQEALRLATGSQEEST